MAICTLLDLKPSVEPILSATDKRLLDCREQYWKIYQECSNHHHTMLIGHCFIRYCPDCMDAKISRCLKRLAPYKRFFGKMCKHIILTVPYGQYSKQRKEDLEDAKRKFFQILHRKGMTFHYCAAFDYGNPKSSDPTETNIHIHVAANMRFVNFEMLHDAWCRATGSPFAVIKINSYAKTNAVFRYIARRMAGDFGHGCITTSFKDVGMTTAQYDLLIRGSRVFTHSECPECKKLRTLKRKGVIATAKPLCLSCKNSADVSQDCPICGEPFRVMCVMHYENMGMESKWDIVSCNVDWIPPPDLEEGVVWREQNDFKKYPRLPFPEDLNTGRGN